MERFLFLLSFLVIAAAAAATSDVPVTPAETYWRKTFPNSLMPSAIQDLLRSVFAEVYVDEKGTGVGIGKGGIQVNTRKGKPGGVSVHVPPMKKPVNVEATPVTAVYTHAATKTQIRDDPTTTLFFLEKDLQPGTKMNLHFTRTTSGVPFISHRMANSIPFSSSKLPEILDRLSIQTGTAEADVITNTLRECEEPALDGESKHCATSLESMVEFSTSSLGTRDVQASSTTVSKEGTPEQAYIIAPSGVHRLAGSEVVVCHAMSYAYAVFYCHAVSMTRAYRVTLEGKDGTEVKAVVVCHTDTARWDAKYVAFQVLNVKPGTVSVCHFLPQDHIVWSPKQ